METCELKTAVVQFACTDPIQTVVSPPILVSEATMRISWREGPAVSREQHTHHFNQMGNPDSILLLSVSLPSLSPLPSLSLSPPSPTLSLFPSYSWSSLTSLPTQRAWMASAASLSSTWGKDTALHHNTSFHSNQHHIKSFHSNQPHTMVVIIFLGTLIRA